jgi:hypothetical protein
MTNLEHLMNSIERAQESDFEILKNGGVDNNNYMLKSDDKIYQIEKNEDGEISTCNCPHSHYRDVVCKHMVYISLHLDVDIEGLSVDLD